jgi:hypothetical protein
MQNSLEQTVIRTRQYWYIDGFIEMLTGVVFILLATLNALSGWIEPLPAAGLFIGIGFPVVILGGILLGGRVVKYFKNRITFPRTGFIQYAQPEPSIRRKKAIKAGAVSGVISILFGIFASGFNPSVITIGTGLLIAIMMVVFAVRIPLKRFYITALFTVFFGIIGVTFKLEPPFQTAILLFGTGITLISSGLYSLSKYLAATQPSDTGAGEAR